MATEVKTPTPAPATTPRKESVLASTAPRKESVVPQKLIDDTVEQVEAKLTTLLNSKDKWAKLSAGDKCTLLKQCLELLKKEIPTWVRSACIARGYDPDNTAQADLLAGVYFLGPFLAANWLAELVTVYDHLSRTGVLPELTTVTARPNGLKRVLVNPLHIKDKAVMDGKTCHIFVQHASKEEMKLEQTNPLSLPGGVTGILGAGNYDGPVDILHVLFIENKVALYKANPVNQLISTSFARIFQPLISAGYLQLALGGAEIGATIIKSEKVDDLCMTGSCKTYDRIKWAGNESKTGEPTLTKPMMAELGSVNPYIVVPGKWTDKELDAHAQMLVVAKLFNGGHICASPQVVMTCKNWPQREAFLEKVRGYLAAHPPVRNFYPGASRSYEAQLKALIDSGYEANAVVVKKAKKADNESDPLFAVGVKEDAFALKEEAFCSVLVELPFDTAPNAQDFLPAAVQFVNKGGTWGSLTGIIVIDGITEAANRDVLEQAIDDIQVGALGVNMPAAMGIWYPGLVWGGYPGRHSIQDIQSGIGILGNLYGYKHVKKAVLRAPFTYRGQLTLPDSKYVAVAERYTDYALEPSWWKIVKLALAV